MQKKYNGIYKYGHYNLSTQLAKRRLSWIWIYYIETIGLVKFS